MGILEIRNVTLDIADTHILDKLSIDFWPSHVHAIVGPNGAGKSSLAFSIMGLEGYRNISGDILFKGESIAGLDIPQRSRRGITLAWQEPARFEGLTARRLLTAAARDHDEERVMEAMERMDLDPERYLDRAVDATLSGGERKKIELASILVMQPELVLLDEPDSGIDVASLQRIFEAIAHLKENGTTVVLITHSLEVLKQAEHAFLICCGRLVDKGGVDTIGRYFEDRCIPCDHPNQPELR